MEGVPVQHTPFKAAAVLRHGDQYGAAKACRRPRRGVWVTHTNPPGIEAGGLGQVEKLKKYTAKPISGRPDRSGRKTLGSAQTVCCTRAGWPALMPGFFIDGEPNATAQDEVGVIGCGKEWSGLLGRAM
jgi:hypothetical protein